jgi:hypothetical protein
MSFVGTGEVLADSVCKVVSREQPNGLDHLSLAVHPLRFYGVEPRALLGQLTHHDPYSTAAVFDLPVVSCHPTTHENLLSCQEAFSQTTSRAFLPIASSLWQLQERNRVLMALTGRLSTNLSQVSLSSGKKSP